MKIFLCKILEVMKRMGCLTIRCALFFFIANASTVALRAGIGTTLRKERKKSIISNANNGKSLADTEDRY